MSRSFTNLRHFSNIFCVLGLFQNEIYLLVLILKEGTFSINMLVACLLLSAFRTNIPELGGHTATQSYMFEGISWPALSLSGSTYLQALSFNRAKNPWTALSVHQRHSKPAQQCHSTEIRKVYSLTWAREKNIHAFECADKFKCQAGTTSRAYHLTVKRTTKCRPPD